VKQVINKSVYLVRLSHVRRVDIEMKQSGAGRQPASFASHSTVLYTSVDPGLPEGCC
jgi:hypothetical protein